MLNFMIKKMSSICSGFGDITYICIVCIALYINVCVYVCYDSRWKTDRGPRSDAHATRRWQVVCVIYFIVAAVANHHKHEVIVGGCAGGSRPSGATHTCPIPYVGRRRHKPGTHVRFNGVPKLWIRPHFLFL